VICALLRNGCRLSQVPPPDRIPPRQLLAKAIEAFEFLDQRSADPQHGLGNGKQDAIVRNQLQYPRLELLPGHNTNPQTKDLHEPRTEFSRFRALVRSC